jgi:hypothetical protein
MPKRIFWPATLVVMGLIFMAANMELLPTKFWNLWPVILIVVGLGGLLTSDRDQWMAPVRPAAKRRPAKKAKSRRRRR